MSKGIHRLFDIIFIAIIVILLGYFALRVMNRVEIYNVKTGSMEAKIHVGDYILILKKNRYDIGDVITFASNNSYVTHRIVRIDGDKVTTKGDANNTEDETISSSNIVGKVILSGGILNDWKKQETCCPDSSLNDCLLSSRFTSAHELA